MSDVVYFKCMCTFLSGLVNGYIYRCFLLPSSRWFCLNGDIIAGSITSMRGVKWVNIFPTVWKFINTLVTLRRG